MVIAYLRVSTEKQFLANQKEEILRFAEKNGLSIDKWYTETVSGSVSTKERKLAPLLRQMKPGDTLIVTEISRLRASKNRWCCIARRRGMCFRMI